MRTKEPEPGFFGSGPVFKFLETGGFLELYNRGFPMPYVIVASSDWLKCRTDMQYVDDKAIKHNIKSR